jgi:hypothetical protein
MDAAAPAPVSTSVPALLVRHLANPPRVIGRVPAKIRLEQALGPELARRLLTSLASAPRHK